jgi:hypothetical protein
MLPEEREGLRAIRRYRFWGWFFLLTYVPVLWLVKRITHTDVADVPIVLVWVTGFVIAVSRTAFTRCPRCGEFFHSTHGSPTFWNLLTSKCMQCGLPLRADRVIYPSLE